MPEYYDPERCRRCGGKCCAIYLPWQEGGMYPAGQVDFAEWVRSWEDAFRESGALSSGIQPLHDPLVLHMINYFEGPQWAEVRAAGSDPNYCQFWRKDVGCLLPWEYRPQVCREYRCEEWEAETTEYPNSSCAIS